MNDNQEEYNDENADKLINEMEIKINGGGNGGQLMNNNNP